MPNIFLSYRREDSAGHTGRLADVLGDRFGADHVFRDIEGIEPGDDFVAAVRLAIATCDVVLVVIGRDWLDARDAAGRRRLDDPADHVRQEIAAALGRDVRIIPLLVENATMPREADLPDDIAPLARRNALHLRDIAWDDNIDRLTAALTRSRRSTRGEATAETSSTTNARGTRTLPRRVLLAAAVVVALVASALTLPIPGREATTADDGASPSDTVASEAAAPLGTRALHMPGPLTAELGLAVISLRALRIDSYADGDRLVAGFQLENHATVELPFLTREFQLNQGDDFVDALGDTDPRVPVGESDDVEMTFALDPGATAAILRFRHAAEPVEIPLDLRPDHDATPAPPAQTSFDLAVPSGAPLQTDSIEIAIEGARLRRFINRDVVTVRFRARNPSGAMTQVTSQNVRLVVDGAVEPPSDHFEILLPAGATTVDSARFEIPVDTREATVRLISGAHELDLPLHLGSAR